jgi:Fe-S-cluster containining protein
VDAEQRVRLIEQRQGRKIRKLLGESLPGLVQSAEPLDRKVIRLRQLVDKVAAAIAPFTPCRKGCSACCHKAAIVSEMDALQIAQATGARLAVPKNVFEVRDGGEARTRYLVSYAGKPCGFLEDGNCSIYEHRPVVCRVQHSLEDDAAPCEPREGLHAAAMDLTDVYLAELQMNGRMMVYADIREFFPAGMAEQSG